MALRTPSPVHEMTGNVIPEADSQDTDFADKEANSGPGAHASSSDVEEGIKSDGQAEAAAEEAPWDWNEDPANPYNWPSGRKSMQIAIIASVGFLAQVISSALQTKERGGRS